MVHRKTVAVVQSCYIPWKGFFDLINLADEFVLYDDRQFTRRDWRNRNRIKTRRGTRWLTIPVQVKGRYFQRIDETLISDPEWGVKHWQTLLHTYGAAPHFDEYRAIFEDLYCTRERRLSVINRTFIEAICGVLGIRTRLKWSTDYDVEGAKTERLAALCHAAGATDYLSGPTARTYLDESLLEEAGIRLHYMSYSGYPEYDQFFPPFDHHVTVLDLIFHTGPTARHHMKSFGRSDVG